jgi:hypothetical protein
MAKSAEQKSADELLNAAIEATVRAYSSIADDSLVIDFVVVGEAVKYTDEGQSEESYFLAYKNGEGRTTVALGLLTLGLELVTDGEYVRDDDE